MSPSSPERSREAILADITAIAEEHLQWQGPVRPEMRLVEDLGLDSLRLLTLAVEVENHFRILLDDGDEAGIERVADLITIVETKLAAEAVDDGGEGPSGSAPLPTADRVPS